MSTGFVVFLAVFVLAFMLGINMPVGILTACSCYFLFSDMNVRIVSQVFMGGFMSNYVVMAIPLYIFAANVMNHGKITDMIFDFCKGLVGKLPGGLAHVNVLNSLVFAGMTGSAVADASGIGKLEIDVMRKAGYEPEFACSVTAASATLGPIFPPSIPMILYATVSGASVGALFMGGMIPAIILTGFLMIYVAFIAKKRNYPRDPITDIKLFLMQTLKSIPALMTPVILLVGIYTGAMTPTEAGAVAAIYALLLAAFAYKMVGWKDLMNLLSSTVESTAVSALMVGVAPVMSYIISREQIAVRVSEAVLGLTTNPTVFLFIVSGLLLVLGCFVTSSVIQLVVIPLLLPAVVSMGIDLVFFGVLTTYIIMVGLSTPPYGMLLFITSGISETPLTKVIREIWPMIAVMIFVAIVMILFPATVTMLPELLMG